MKRLRRWWRDWQFDIDQWLAGIVYVGGLVVVVLAVVYMARR